MKYSVAHALVLTVLCAAWAGPVIAQGDFLSLGPGSDQPINITSNMFEARNVSGGKETVFLGDVRVTQGDLTLTTDKLVIVYEDDKGRSAPETKRPPRNLQSISGIRSITASGKVKLVQNERMATAGKAEYDNAKRTITLTGGPPRLWQGPDQMMADTIIIYLDENRSELLSGDGTVIKAVINPAKQKRDKK
jgi:lipopolysaccharide transport protein LptA